MYVKIIEEGSSQMENQAEEFYQTAMQRTQILQNIKKEFSEGKNKYNDT